MLKAYYFMNHRVYVDACEQFADDLVDFHAHATEMYIQVTKGELPENTKEWLRKVIVKEE